MLRATLPNGLRLLVDPRGDAPVVAVYLWINVGSVDEPAGMDGAAHVVEHMVFKGTTSYGVGEVSGAVEAVGGDLNAWTSFEETVFHATVPPDGVEVAMRVLAEMLRAARFDGDELERERKVILEEIRGGEDEPGMVLSEATWAAAFPRHPYGRPVIGSVATVSGLGRAALVGFYEQHYQPANACLAVAGPVDPARIERLAAEVLGGGGRAPVRAAGTATPGGSVYRSLRRGFESTLVQLAWPGPGLGHPDVAAVDVLCAALGGAASSPLESRLRLGEGLCLEAGIAYDGQVAGGLSTLYLHPREGRAGDALRAAREEVERVRAGGLPAGEVERARAQILADRVFGRETVDGRAHALAFYNERFGDPYAWRAYDAAILAVDPAAVTRAAREWLAPEREIGVALLPDGTSLRLEPSRRRPPAAPARPAVERVVLDNGVRLLLNPDDGEVAAVNAAGFGGALGATAATAGHGVAWARTLTRGAGRLGALDFPAAVERLAGGLGGVWGRSSQMVRAEFVAANFLGGLGLFLDALLDPSFAEDEVASVRQEMLVALAERDDHPEVRLGELTWRLGMGEHAWALPLGGTPASVGRVRAASVRRIHRSWLGGSGLVVSVAGAFDVDRVRRVLTGALSRLPAARGPVAAPAPVFGGERRASARAGREQAQLAMAWPGVTYADRRQPAVEILAGVLGGQAGRLFRELREERGLAYDVSAAAHDGLCAGLVVASLATEEARLAEAEAAMTAAIARAHEALADDEIDRSRTWLLGGLAHDLQSAASRAQTLAYAELFGLGAQDYAGNVRRRIEATDNDAVRAVARATLSRRLAVVTVRPRGDE